MSNNIDNENFASGQYYGMTPPDGAFHDEQEKYYLQKRPTVGGWVEGSEGYAQQTFLGASITDFNMSAGFNDSPSTLSVSLVVDEHNTSDGVFLGSGDDIYHSGQGDCFSPPPIGAPVFFKFGKNHASTLQAYARSYEMIYKYKLLPTEASLTARKDAFNVTRTEMGDEDNLRLVKDNHLLRQDKGYSENYSEQKPVFDYDNANPPQPETNNTFSNLTETYDPASTGIDPEIFQLDAFTSARGRNHLVFGGILQSYSESKSANGNPLFNATVVDPKEILSSCTLILNDYGETTFNNKNLFNVYGFLEHDISKELKKSIQTDNLVKSNLLTKYDTLDDAESKEFSRYINLEDCYWLKSRTSDPHGREFPQLTSMQIGETIRESILDLPSSKVLKASDVKYWFPITGFGMSRRTDKGMPLYRIVQALGFMNYFLPQEFKDNGFGGPIDFRGYKFALNIQGLNDLFLDESLLETLYDSAFGVEDEDNPDLHPKQRKLCPAKTVADAMKDIYIESDDLTITDLIQQIAETFNKDFVVELLPPIDKKYLEKYTITEEHDFFAVKEISDYNDQIITRIQSKTPKTGVNEQNQKVNLDPEQLYTENDLIAGIISITFIDKNRQPGFDEISKFIQQYEYENANLGYDLVNETTDKFLVGAQKVDLYFFSSYKDRDTRLHLMERDGNSQQRSAAKSEIERIEKEKWTFGESLKQQILPYYGQLADGVASIPIGDGPFQQILLNTQSLNAFGVGEYYLATEMELRAAMVSFEQWSEFILKYSRRYVEGFIDKDDKFTQFPKPKDADLAKIKAQQAAFLGGPLTSELEAEIDSMRCGVSVPRSVFVSNMNYYRDAISEDDEPASPSDLKAVKLPASPCFPPYGYPVYYGRAEAVGVLRPSDVSRLANNSEVIQILTNEYFDFKPEEVQNISDKELAKLCRKAIRELIRDKRQNFNVSTQGKTPQEINNEYLLLKRELNKYEDSLRLLCDEFNTSDDDSKQLIRDAFIESNGNFLGFVNTIMRINLENAKKVHAFIKSIADEHLGKSFLVKIPNKTNISYTEDVKTNDAPAENGRYITQGPFGFKSIYQSGKVIPTGDTTNLLFQDFLFTEHVKDPEDHAFGVQYNPYVIDNIYTGRGSSKTYTSSELDSGLTKITGLDDLSIVFDYEPKLPGTGQKGQYLPEILQSNAEQARRYEEGALRPRYNPVKNDWDFNYTPQDKGGWYNFEIPQDALINKSNLYPVDAEKLKKENNRISAYAIYNNSQTIHFRNGNLNSIIQEVNDGDKRRMDIVTKMDNVGTEEPQLESPLNTYTEETVGKFDPNRKYLEEYTAFLKSTVEEKLLFAPRFCLYENLQVSSAEFQLLEVQTSALDFITEDVIEGADLDRPLIPSGKKLIQSSFINTVFAPKDKPSHRRSVVSLEYANVFRTIEGDLDQPQTDVDGNPNPDAPEEKITEIGEGDLRRSPQALVTQTKPSMNSEHVYALVKLPARPVSNIDRRFVDGPQNSTNPVTVAKIWNRDTIKGGGPWKNSLSEPPALTQGIEEEKIKYISSLNNNTNRTAITEVLPLANPEILIDYVHPSPLLPDTIAIPLMSKERCYGPWRSNASIALDYTRKGGCNETFLNIGGKVEYVKDEELSPWKFDGYENMNKAGEIQVSFSNNLLLFTEKGNFTVPDVVPGIYIGRPLAHNIPLVDSISLSVDGNGIKTTVSMEMFSTKYGRTKKQRQEQLSRLTREEKLRRQNKNRLIRAGAERPTPNEDLEALIGSIGSVDAPSAADVFSGLQKKQTVYDSLVASVVPIKTQSIVYNPQEENPEGSGVTVIKTSNSAAFQSKGYLQEIQSNYTDINELNNSLQRTGGSILNDIYFPFDEDVYNPFMTNMPYVDIDSITKRTS